MFVLDIKESTNHLFEFIKGMECPHSIVGEAGDEIGALSVYLILFGSGGSFKDLFMEVTGGDGGIEALGVKVASGPFIVGGDEDSTHILVLADFPADKVKGLGGSHGVEDVMKSVIFVLFGLFNLGEEFLFVDGFDEGVQVNQDEVLVGDEFLCEFVAFGEGWEADNKFLFDFLGGVRGGFVAKESAKEGDTSCGSGSNSRWDMFTKGFPSIACTCHYSISGKIIADW